MLPQQNKSKFLKKPLSKTEILAYLSQKNTLCHFPTINVPPCSELSRPDPWQRWSLVPKKRSNKARVRDHRAGLKSEAIIEAISTVACIQSLQVMVQVDTCDKMPAAYKVVTNYDSMFSDLPQYPSHSYVPVRGRNGPSDTR